MIKYKYLTLLYRNDIQLGLERDETFKVIRRAILKDLTTISKRINPCLLHFLLQYLFVNLFLIVFDRYIY